MRYKAAQLGHRKEIDVHLASVATVSVVNRRTILQPDPKHGAFVELFFHIPPQKSFLGRYMSLDGLFNLMPCRIAENFEALRRIIRLLKSPVIRHREENTMLADDYVTQRSEQESDRGMHTMSAPSAAYQLQAVQASHGFSFWQRAKVLHATLPPLLKPLSEPFGNPFCPGFRLCRGNSLQHAVSFGGRVAQDAQFGQDSAVLGVAGL